MGQAKQRGTREQRILQAIQKKYQCSQLQIRTFDDIRREFDISLDSKPLGYIISISGISQFLSSHSMAEGMLNTEFSSHPINAVVFDDFDKIAPIARNISKQHATDICYMFETQEKLEVVPVVVVDS